MCASFPGRHTLEISDENFCPIVRLSVVFRTPSLGRLCGFGRSSLLASSVRAVCLCFCSVTVLGFEGRAERFLGWLEGWGRGVGGGCGEGEATVYTQRGVEKMGDQYVPE